ncbi:MAG: hypothetical protein ABI835_19255 [Chloroflexota bacterium]
MGEIVDENIQKLIDSIFDTHSDGGIDCEQCCQQFNCLVELVAAGTELREMLPAVEAHLRCCQDCREEYQALLSIIVAENQGLLTQARNENE